jgi:formyl-CoA transferase
MSTREIIDDPTLRANGVVTTVEHPERGSYDTVSSPIRLSDSPVDVVRSPLLGEHNAEVYGGELGLSDEDLAELASNGVI